MLVLYLLYLSFLVYLHNYVYILGDRLLLQFFKDGSISTETIKSLSTSNIIKENTNSDIVMSVYKRKYITKNIWKSFMLLLILIGSTLQFFDGFFNNVWSNLSFQTWGTVYVALDLSGLIYVRGLPLATVIHHVVVNILGIVHAQTDYNTPGYYRSILIYTYFSVIPFLVNFYLGYRYLDKDSHRKKRLAYYSYRIYQFSLISNMVCQFIFFLYEPFHYSIILYVFLYCLILNDDIKLIRFLRNESNSKCESG